MTRTVVLAALSGFALSAQAQNFSLDLVASTSGFVEGGSFTLSVYGNADQGTHILGGVFSLVSNTNLIADTIWTPAA